MTAAAPLQARVTDAPPLRARSAWQIPVGAGLLLLASAAFHTVVLVVAGDPWDGPVSWRKPITFGLSFGISVLTVTWICRILPLTARTRALLLGAFTTASLLETGLITLQAWRGVPSHFNTETTFDTFVTRALAAGGVTLIVVVVALTFAALRPHPTVAPSMRLALRAGLLALTGSMAAGAVMIAYGLTLEGAGRAADAYRSAGFLRPAHAVTMHAVLLLPALALLLGRTRRPEAERLRLIRITVAAYGAVVALVTAAAAAGLTFAGPATTAAVSAGVTTAPALAFLALGASPTLRKKARSAPRTPSAGGRVRRLPQPWRKAVLTLHVTVAVGWVGVEIAQLVLGLVGLTTDDAGLVRATRVVMEILGLEVVVGMAWTTLLTGLLLAAATQWGLLKHYWIVTKLVVTVVLMLDGHLLLQHWLREQAEVSSASESLGLRLVVSMSVALVLLVAATAVSVYKPWGRTRRGRRPAATARREAGR